MRIKKSVIVMAVGLTVVACLAFGLQNSSQHKVLFEKAKFTMETKGDLRGAIDLFEEIIQKYPDERDYAAKSLYFIGICYEKLGEQQAQQAQAAFQRIVEDYPEQTDAVKLAKDKLSSLQRAQAPAMGDGEFRIREVLPFGVFGAPSLDGRFFSFRAGSGDLAVLNIATKKEKLLTDKASWNTGGFVGHSVISPDSQKIAYCWVRNYGPYDLKIVNIDGSGERILFPSDDTQTDENFWPYDWSLDGKQILGFLTKEKEGHHIAFISAFDGQIRRIKHVGGVSLNALDLSPDGKWIAYEYPQDANSEKKDIILLPANGSQESSLVKHPANDKLLGWTPRGDGILFASDRSGTWDAWLIPWKDGQTHGEPLLVKHDFGMIGGPTGLAPLGFTQDGSFFYRLESWREDVFTTTLNRDRAEILVPPRKVVKRFEGTNCYSVWSPDGKYLAFTSRRGADSKALCFLSGETGEQRDLFLSLKGSFGRLDWFPDGKSVLLVGTDMSDRRGIHKVDIKTGEIEPIVTEGQGFHSPRCTPDGKYVFYEIDSWEDSVFRIMRHDLNTGKSKEFYRSSSQIIRMDVSPDGKLLAFPEWADGTLKIIPVEGGEPRAIHEFEEETWCTSVAWSPDGKYLFISKVPKGEDKTGRLELWRISIDGSEPVEYPLVVQGMGDLSFHPDGQQLAFSDWKVDYATYVMENFLPPAKK